jgi:hypothetical protein
MDQIHCQRCNGEIFDGETHRDAGGRTICKWCVSKEQLARAPAPVFQQNNYAADSGPSPWFVIRLVFAAIAILLACLRACA